VAEVEDYADALARIPGEALGIEPLANCFLDCVPLREGWHGYLAQGPDAGAPGSGERRALVLQG